MLDDHDNVVANPNEILWGWTYEQVLTAIDIKELRAERRARAKEILERQVPKRRTR